MAGVEEMVERVWPGREAVVEVLGGGITNRNFKVTLDDGAYVLRIGGKDTELLGIDRRAEYEASVAAAAVGVGPEVVAFVEPEGYLVTRYIEGTVVVPEAIGVDAAFPALFLALLAPYLRDRRALLTAIVAGAITLVLIPVAPPGVPIVAASLAALIGLRR